MKDAKNLLNGLLQGLGKQGQGASSGGLGGLGGLGSLLGGQSSGAQPGQSSGGLGGGGGLGGLAEQAKGAWGRQSGVTKGAIAGGGLLALLLGGKSTANVAGGALKMGGMAIVGSLAYKAWQDWQAGKTAQVGTDTSPEALPAPEGTAFLPDDQDAADDLATRLLQAMVAAAKADGHVTPDERARIESQLAELGLDAEAERLIAEELDAPLDVGRVAALARTPEEAAEIYTLSLMVADEQNAAEKGYLAMLAARMNLDPGLVEHLHARVNSLA